MKQDNIVMVLLLGAAGYLIYKWMYPETAAAVTPTTPTPTVTPVTQPSGGTTVQPGTVSTTPAVPTPPAAPAQLSTAAAQIKAQGMVGEVTKWAALGLRNASLAGVGSYDPVAVITELGVTYNSDEWNFFRGAAGGDVPNVDLFPAGNRNYKMTIAEYLAARSSAGLSGIMDLTWDYPFYGVPN